MESTPHAIREETLGDKGIAQKKEETKERLEENREVCLQQGLGRQGCI